MGDKNGGKNGGNGNGKGKDGAERCDMSRGATGVCTRVNSQHNI